MKRHRKLSSVLVWAVALLVLASSSAFGVVYVKWDSPGPTLDGNSWATAYHSVQEGVDDAATLGEEVWVAAGTYVECITLKCGVGMYGGFAGTESTRDERDWITNVTILDGNQQGRVVTAADCAATFSAVDGFTIRNGNASGADGGGIYCDMSSPAITNNRITGNRASYDGGGIYCIDASPTITNNVIAGNQALDVYSCGGGIYCWYSSPTISNNTITANSASDGGGVYCDYGSTPILANNIVAFNSSGICRYGSDTPVLHHNCVHGNTDYEYSGIGPGPGDIPSDPWLVDRNNGDYRLLPSSPCIDAADGDAAPAIDLAANPRYDYPLTANTGTGAPPYVDIGAYEYVPVSVGLAQAKRLPDLWAVNASGLVVTAAFSGYFYAQVEDRSAGIRVEWEGAVSEKERVDLGGIVATNSAGERYIDASTVTLVGAVTDLYPLGLTNEDVGGGDWFYDPATGAGQRGVLFGAGLNNIGLFVRSWGRVSHGNTDYFYIDDGSAADDGSGHVGVKVSAAGLATPAQGSYVEITGISSCFKTGDNLYRLILARSQSDIVVVE